MITPTARFLSQTARPRTWLTGLVLFVSLSAVFVALNTASALTLANVSGSWSNAGPGQPSCLNIANSPGGSFVSYGVPLDETCPEGVDFSRQSGFGFQPIEGVDFAPGAVFALGEFTHYNRFIYDEEPLHHVDLSIDLNFSAPAGLSVALVYTVNLEETLNIPGTCAYGAPGDIPCPDRVSFASTVGLETFVYNDIEYTLELLGFAPKTGATCVYSGAVNEFITQEDQDNTACLFGRVIASDASLSIRQTLAQAQPLRPGTDADFTIYVDNDGATTFDRVEIAATACDGPPVLQSGDANADGLLDPGETWVYTCRAGDVTASFTNTVMVGVSRLEMTRIDRLVDLPVEVARLSSLTVALTTDGGGPTFDFVLSGSPTTPFSLGAGQQLTLGDLMPGTYRLAQGPVAGWTLAGVVCQGAQQSKVTPVENGILLELAQGEAITCTFESAVQAGTIRVLSHQIPRGSDATDGPRLEGWTYTLFTGEDQAIPRVSGADGVARWDDLRPGTYTICQETPGGWQNLLPGDDACYTATFTEPGFERTFRFANVPLAADLALFAGGPAQAEPENEVAYGFRVLNNGPDDASGVRLQINLPQGLELLAAPQNCAAENGALVCRWDGLGNQQAVGVEIQALVVAEGTLRVTAAVDAAQPPDPDGNNNRVEVVTIVEPPVIEPRFCTQAEVIEAIEAGFFEPPLPEEPIFIELPGVAVCQVPPGLLIPVELNEAIPEQSVDEIEIEDETDETEDEIDEGETEIDEADDDFDGSDG